MLNNILEKVTTAINYSITMNITMNISTRDSVFVLRYVRNIMNRNYKMCSSFKKVLLFYVHKLFDLLKTTLNSIKINLKNCVSDACYSTVNMNGHYKGVQAKFKKVSLKHFYIWFYPHVLN